MSTEDVEEIVVEVKDKQIEPAEGVQQPMEEPEVMIQEVPPGPSQPEPVSYTHLDVYKRQELSYLINLCKP